MNRPLRNLLRVFKWAAVIAAPLFLLAAGIVAVLCHSALYRRFCLFPAQARAWGELRAGRTAVTLDDGWPEFRGVMHAHSERSHDSEVPFPAIAAALRQAGADFIFMSDHPVDGQADYAKGWKGMHDGILFVRGYEMQSGLMPWGIPDGTILFATEPPDVLAARIKALGGVLFFAHAEEDRPWALPQLTGMELCNLHADLKRADRRQMAQDLLLSFSSYPEQVLWSYFQRPTANLKKWDELNRTRRVTGIAGNDAHQNVGVRGVYGGNGMLCLLDTGHRDKVFKALPLNSVTRFLLRAVCGPLEPGRQLFRIDLDPYERTARFVNTHLLARELTEPALLEALRHGRAYVGFDLLADSRGFVWLARGKQQRAVMGETIPLEPGLVLAAASPVACRFSILRDGELVARRTGTLCVWPVARPGNYRVEAELDILGEWTPWVYANPITVVP
jgi:hypothetical protein